MLRQFDVGFHDPAEPEVPQVSNSINIGNMTGSTIQQGSPNASQSVQFTLNVETARTALTNFETAISEVSLPADTLATTGLSHHKLGQNRLAGRQLLLRRKAAATSMSIFN